MRTDDVLAQIDTALGDHTVGPDAMRCTPAPAPPAAAVVSVADGAGEWVEIGTTTDDGLEMQSADEDQEDARGWRGATPVIVIHEEIEVRTDVLARWTAVFEELQRTRAARARELHQVLLAAARTIQPAMEAAARAVREVTQMLQSAGLADEDGKPVRPQDRPAWQSPYGPPARRRGRR